MFDRQHSGDDLGEVFGIVVLALVAVSPILYVPPLIACLAQISTVPAIRRERVGHAATARAHE